MNTTKIILLLLFTNLLFAKTIDELSNDSNSEQLLQITNLNAVQSAFNDSSNTDNIKICRYSERAICKVRIRERMPAIIELPKFDKIKTKILGDTKNFSFDEFDESRQRGMLRGIYPGADTNLMIVGESGFVYSFYIRIDSVNSQFVPDFVVYLKTNNKDTNTLEALQDIRKSNEKKQELANSQKHPKQVTKQELDYLDKKQLINTNNLNFNYKQIDGDKSLMPNAIFDDGIWTYFKYGKQDLISSKDLPVIYQVKDGFDVPRNSRIEGPYLIVETTGGSWTIRAGGKHACVRKEL
jgi:type IV secretory pathway VirB9-like protein